MFCIYIRHRRWMHIAHRTYVVLTCDWAREGDCGCCVFCAVEWRRLGRRSEVKVVLVCCRFCWFSHVWINFQCAKSHSDKLSTLNTLSRHYTDFACELCFNVGDDGERRRRWCILKSFLEQMFAWSAVVRRLIRVDLCTYDTHSVQH